MSYINQVQNAILELGGGEFQKLFDAYLYIKFHFKNIQTLGVQSGTNKPTKGIPDSFVFNEDTKKYILINYGSVKAQAADKIKKDILDCFNSKKLKLGKENIEKIICGYSSTNITPDEDKELRNSVEGVTIELIGLSTLSHDLVFHYQYHGLAQNFLGISIVTGQILELEDFVNEYDKNTISSPIKNEFLHREIELNEICQSIENNAITILTGPSGVGKTRIAVEACRKCSDDYKVLCVLSNHRSLLDDISYYFDQSGKYLLFFDDANTVSQLKETIKILQHFSKDCEIKILITVRDYVKEEVRIELNDFENPNIIQINNFKNDEIKDILSNNLEIANERILSKITEISCGNIRIAYLAGLSIKKDGDYYFKNIEDIFQRYYGKVLSESNLLKEELLILFFVACSRIITLNDKNSSFYTELKAKFLPNVNDEEVINKLNSIELLDVKNGKAAKVSDQSFENYIYYYVLYFKKYIKIEELLSCAFPTYKDKIIYILGTLIHVFQSSEFVVRYISDHVKLAWDNAPENQYNAYFENFYIFDLDKSLSIIQDRLEKETKIDLDLRSVDIDVHKPSSKIVKKEISILANLRNTEEYETAFNLLLDYFEKCPNLLLDVYCAICQGYLYDEYSAMNDFKVEKMVINELWKRSKYGENYNYTILFIHVAEEALNTSITHLEQNLLSCSFVHTCMSLNYSTSIAVLRKLIWQSFSELRRQDDYCEKIEDILLKTHIDTWNHESAISFLKSDFDSIFSTTIDPNQVHFKDALIIDTYRRESRQLGVPDDARYDYAFSNKAFKIYDILNFNFLSNEDKSKQKKKIENEIHSYKEGDYKSFFETCSYIEKNINENKQWSLSEGIDSLFDVLEENKNMYVSVFVAYLDAGAPFKHNISHYIPILLKFFGYKETKDLIEDSNLKDQAEWLVSIWKNIDEKEIDRGVLNDYQKFLEHNFKSSNPIIPSVDLLEKYGKRNPAVKKLIIQKISESPIYSYNFLKSVYFFEDIDKTLNIFCDDIETLIKIYINALQENALFEYERELFKSLYRLKPEIWVEFIDFVKSDKSYCKEYYKDIIDFIWSNDNWKENINKLVEKIFFVDSYFKDSVANIVFCNEDDEKIADRKKQWLYEALHENLKEIKKTKILIKIVVNVLPDQKKDYILEFLKLDNDIEHFKTISLMTCSESWSGSEIPLINKKIKFYEELKSGLKGSTYIKHKAYLSELIKREEKYKKKVELHDFVYDTIFE